MIEWSPDTATFIANALSPAKPTNVALSESENVATVIVPTDQMSLAIGKEGQNARLAYKLTQWRIDIKDPESLKDQDLEMLRQARSEFEEDSTAIQWQGRQPRLVRPDGMVAVRDHEYGPLPDDLIGMSADVEINGDVLEVYYNRMLRARFEVESGEQLPLDD